MGSMTKAVIESADFGPAHDGEAFVILTFRVPADTRCPAGLWELTPIGPGKPDWAASKNDLIPTKMD